METAADLLVHDAELLAKAALATPETARELVQKIFANVPRFAGSTLAVFGGTFDTLDDSGFMGGIAITPDGSKLFAVHVLGASVA